MRFTFSLVPFVLVVAGSVCGAALDRRGGLLPGQTSPLTQEQQDVYASLGILATRDIQGLTSTFNRRLVKLNPDLIVGAETVGFARRGVLGPGQVSHLTQEQLDAYANLGIVGTRSLDLNNLGPGLLFNPDLYEQIGKRGITLGPELNNLDLYYQTRKRGVLAPGQPPLFTPEQQAALQRAGITVLRRAVFPDGSPFTPEQQAQLHNLGVNVLRRGNQ